MERSHGGLDQSVLNAGSATLPHPTHLQVSPGLHSVLGVRPSSTLASMQLSYPAAISVDRIKRDDVGSDAPAVLSLPIQTAERTRLLYAGGESMRPYPALAGFHELTGNRSVVPRPVPSQLPACNIIDFVSASNAFTFLMAQADAPPLCASSPLPLVSPGKLRTCEQVPHRSVEDGPISESCSKSMGPSSPSKLRNNQIVLHTENPNISSLKTDIGPLADKLGECTSGSLPPPKLCTDDVSDYPCSDSPISLDSPDKQDAIISSEEVSGTHRHEKTHMQSSYKRRKTQQKRVVFVPVGDVKQMKGETPPSDSWAWRKYGQKPIKGSPYPRGYYRCSSSKGCSARKQVERSCADPTMLIVTYTSEHNHGLPAGKTNSTISLQMEKQSFTPSSPPPPSSCQVEVTEASTTASNREHPRESPFSSIINSAHSADGHGDSSLDLPEEDRLSSKRGADMCFVQRSTIIEEDGVFDDLEELPEMSSMFSGSYLVSAEDGWFT